MRFNLGGTNEQLSTAADLPTPEQKIYIQKMLFSAAALLATKLVVHLDHRSDFFASSRAEHDASFLRRFCDLVVRKASEIDPPRTNLSSINA
jgi:hypothetical protein